jgi:hypothetical protein
VRACRRHSHSTTETKNMPSLLYDIIRVLLLLAGPAAFVCLLNAGIALRREGGTVFWVGGGFSKWMLWAVIFLGLEPTVPLANCEVTEMMEVVPDPQSA